MISRVAPTVRFMERHAASTEESIGDLVKYLACKLELNGSPGVMGIELSEISSLDNGLSSHRPGVLMRECVNSNNTVNVAVKTLNSKCFACYLLARDLNGVEIPNSKLLAAIIAALGGERNFSVTKEEMDKFLATGEVSPRSPTIAEQKEKPIGLLPLREVMPPVAAIAKTVQPVEGHPSPDVKVSSEAPSNLAELALSRYRFGDLLERLRERSLGGKKELLFADIIKITLELFTLPEPKKPHPSRFLGLLQRIHFVERIGDESPAKYKVIGRKYDEERRRALKRFAPPRAGSKNVSVPGEGDVEALDTGGKIARLQSMAEEFRSASSAIAAIREELTGVEQTLQEHESNKSRIAAIEEEIKNLRSERERLQAKKNIRGVPAHRDALQGKLAKLQAILASPVHQSAEAKLRQLEALLKS